MKIDSMPPYLKTLWSFILFSSISLIAVVLPNNVVEGLREHQSTTEVDLFCSLIFLLDFLFRYPYRIKASIREERLLQRIWLGIDILSIIPWRLLFGIPLLDLMRLLKLFRVPALFSERNSHYIYFNIILQLVSFTYWVLLWVHWLACGWLLLSDSSEEYLRALYWAVTTLTTVGYGDVTPQTTSQTIYTMIVMLLGVGVYGYIIGNVTTLLSRIDMSKALYQNKIQQLHSFLHYRRVPPELQRKIFNYYEYVFENRMGFNEETLLQDLSPSLQKELSLALKKELISKVPFFAHASSNLIHELSKKLKPIIYLPNDIIFSEGDISKEMFFIGRGTLAIYKGDDENPIAILQDGNCFGELSLIHAKPRNATAKALHYCDLYSLNKEDFEEILTEYPKFAQHIQSIAEMRKH